MQEREKQLTAYDWDFKRIYGEVCVADVLGDLELSEDLVNEDESYQITHAPTKLDSVMEEVEINLVCNTSLPWRVARVLHS